LETTFFIIAQVLGICALIIFCSGIQIKEKNDILKRFAISSIFKILQYLFLGAFTGVAMFTIVLAKNLSFYSYEKKTGNRSVAMLIFFVIVSIILGILTYTSIFSVLPIITTTIGTYTLWQRRASVTRAGVIAGAMMLIVYNFYVSAYTGVLGGVVVIVSTIYSIWKNDIKKSEGKEVSQSEAA